MKQLFNEPFIFFADACICFIFLKKLEKFTVVPAWPKAKLKLRVKKKTMTNASIYKLMELLIVVLIYVSSDHRTTSDANFRTIGTLFIAVTILCLEESAPAYRSFFPLTRCSCGFLRILVH